MIPDPGKKLFEYLDPGDSCFALGKSSHCAQPEDMLGVNHESRAIP
jgi:hypothetical protein